MLTKILDIFKAPPEATEKIPANEVQVAYKQWRWRMFYSMFIVYVVFYMCRKNISVAMPGMADDLGYSCTELGILGSTLYITYAFGKFLNGVLADKANIRTFLTAGLFVTAAINLIFGLSGSLWIFVLLWGLNGWVQSMGFPPIAKGLTHWFGHKERATKWSIWSTAHEVGTTIAIYLSGIILAYFSWRYVFIFPALFTLIIVVFIYDRMRDTPASIGLPTIEEYKHEHEIDQAASLAIEKENIWQTFLKHILPNKVLWTLSITYIFVYIVRIGTIDWLFMFFLKFKDYDEIQAAAIAGLTPLIGILGTVSAGFLSDKFFNGHRMPLNLLSFIILGISILLLVFLPDKNYWVDIALVGSIGIFTCIPQVLVGGVCAAESGSKKVASAATGFAGMFGYIGASVAGAATGYLVDTMGWAYAIYFWAIAGFIGAVLTIFMLRVEAKLLKECDE